MLSPCDSDSLQHYADFNDLARKEKLDKNFTDWNVLFARRDPVERLVDHFMDTCVREARPCFDCRLDLKCYLTIIHSVIKDLAKNIKLVTEDHLKYVPQNWYCQMETMSQRLTFVDYNLFANPTNPEYADAKRPDKWHPEDIFDDPLSSHEKIHRYYITFIHSRPDVLDLVKKIYYWDFLLLKMPLPELKVAETKDFKDGWH
ncbi:unnamed protein product [Caenorhabditis sp. 36 PRJEB53466]|nr:unnamed protein product [Caenorhabditis sp. 36 PRJEB53466]